MAENKIEFRKVRDFGEILGEVFQFLRQEGKAFFRVFFAICGVFMLLHAVLTGWLNANVFSGALESSFSNKLTYTKLFTANYFVTVLVSAMSYTSMQVTVFSYITAYVANGNVSPDIEQVWKMFTKYFFKVFLFTIPLYLLIVVGMLFCLAPGIYFAVVFAPFALVLINEDLDFGDAFSRCMYLIKANFWPSIGLYFVAVIIYYIAHMVIGVAVGAAAGAVAYLTTNDISSVVATVTSFLSVFGLCFYLLPLLTIAFNYFNLVEQKEGTGILNRIGSIGKGNTNQDNNEEEF